MSTASQGGVAGDAGDAGPPPLSVWCCTYNVGGQLPSTLPDAWVAPAMAGGAGTGGAAQQERQPPDVCVFGLQEMDNGVVGLLTGTAGVDAGGSAKGQPKLAHSALRALVGVRVHTRARARVCEKVPAV